MKLKPLKTTREKRDARGLVPSSTYGIQDKAYGAYLEKLDPLGREEVRFALAAAPDVRFQLFLKGISSPKNRLSFQAHAKMCGIGLQEFNEWFSKASTQQAIATFQNASPKIAAHMALDAESTMRACSRCDGLGFVNADEGLPMETPGYRILRFVKVKTEEGMEDKPIYIRACPEGCDNGKVRKPGDQFSREKLLEASGLINRKGPGFTLALNFGGQSMASAVPRLSESMTIDVDSE